VEAIFSDRDWDAARLRDALACFRVAEAASCWGVPPQDDSCFAVDAIRWYATVEAETNSGAPYFRWTDGLRSHANYSRRLSADHFVPWIGSTCCCQMADGLRLRMHCEQGIPQRHETRRAADWPRLPDGHDFPRREMRDWCWPHVRVEFALTWPRSDVRVPQLALPR
jgi:hypothetical protein